MLTAVGSRSGDEVLKACPIWACRKQLLAPRIRAGFRPSRDTAFSSFLPLLWLSSFSVVNCSLVLRAAYAAVCDCYPFQEATSFFLPPFFLCQVFRQLAAMRMLSPSLGNVPAFAPVELSLTFPLLLVLRLGLNSPSHNLEDFR